jgi:aspartate ammonia-lyase
MTFSILDSMELLENALQAFTEKCLIGLGMNFEANDRHANSIIPRLTRLARLYGYAPVNALCREAGDDLVKLKALLDQHFPD